MGAHAFNTRSQEPEEGNLEFEASLDHIAHSKPA